MTTQDYQSARDIKDRLVRLEQKLDTILKLLSAQADYQKCPSPIETEIVWNNN